MGSSVGGPRSGAPGPGPGATGGVGSGEPGLGSGTGSGAAGDVGSGDPGAGTGSGGNGAGSRCGGMVIMFPLSFCGLRMVALAYVSLYSKNRATNSL